jgi:hypothetical protein
MAYIAAADFTIKGRKSWTRGLTFTEAEGDATAIDAVIADVELWVNDKLQDDFEPAGGDPDTTIDIDGSGTARLYIPKRIRSLTTVSTRAADGTLTAQASTLWRLHSSIEAGVLVGKFDYLDVIEGKTLQTVGNFWPMGTQTVRLVGKFGWAAPPNDIKRLVALLVYDYLKPADGKLRKTRTLDTRDATYTFVAAEEMQTGIREADDIFSRYSRSFPVVVG